MEIPGVEEVHVCSLGISMVEEVLLADGHAVVQTLVSADGYHRIAHLQCPAVHHLLDVDVLPFLLHRLTGQKAEHRPGSHF